MEKGIIAMENLFVCETYFQLIVSIFVKCCFLTESKCDIIVTNNTKGMAEIYKKLKAENCFQNIYYLNSYDELRFERNYRYYRHLFQLFLGRSKEIEERFFDKEGISFCYDNIYFFNNDLLNWFICDVNTKRKPNYKQYIIEEGVLGYSYLIKPIRSRGLEILARIRKRRHNRFLRDRIEGVFCMFPEIIEDHEGYQFYKIPMDKMNELLPLISRIFDCGKEDCEIKEKYIYFGGCYDADGIHIDEEELVTYIADVVGKENIVVKKHPRDNRNIYEKNGIKALAEKKNIPWEVMFMTGDYSGKVFLTLSSASIISAFAMNEKNGSGYYLFPLYHGKNPRYDALITDQKIGMTLEKLKECGSCSTVSILYDEDELKNSL